MITIPQIITLDIGPLRKNYNHKLGGGIPMKDFKKYLISKNIVQKKLHNYLNWIVQLTYISKFRITQKENPLGMGWLP